MITFEGKTYEPLAGETLLDCLTREGVPVPSFCKSGACQTCVMKLVRGAAPPRSQQGLKETWIQQGFVLSCVCPTEADLEIEFCEAAGRFPSRIVETRLLSPRVALVRLERPPGLEFQAGQFVQVIRPSDGVCRPYSISSLPEDEVIELHVAIQPAGELSPWLVSSSGETVDLRGPYGECFYVSGEGERPLVFAGTGTGLAPLYGVLRSAVAQGHRGDLTLYHGARNASDLYFTRELSELAMQTGCRVVELSLDAPHEAAAEAPRQIGRIHGDLVDVVLRELTAPESARIYLCGAPDLVQRLKKKLYLKGASLSRIHADPFFAKGGQPPPPSPS